MKTLASVLQFILLVAVAVAAVCGLVGFLIAHFGRLGPAAQGAGWGMAVGGALLGLIFGQSGSPSRMAVEGRWGFFGHYWGQNPALPQTPLTFLAAALLVLAAGIALIVLTY